jgi:cytochrome c peroxidase
MGEDMGRYHIDHREDHKYLWRVPTLRNVALTAPYFHNGSVATLEEAVRVMAKTQFNFEVSDAEVADIVGFLQSLSGEFPPLTPPAPP